VRRFISACVFVFYVCVILLAAYMLYHFNMVYGIACIVVCILRRITKKSSTFEGKIECIHAGESGYVYARVFPIKGLVGKYIITIGELIRGKGRQCLPKYF